MSYETWAFEGLDANGLVGLHVSDFGFRIVTTQIPRRTLKSYPMETVQSWSSTKKIFKFSFTETSPSSIEGGARVLACQLCTTWVPAIMETIDKVVAKVINKRVSRQMSDGDFAAFIRELDAIPFGSDERSSMVHQFAQDNYVTAAQGREAVRRIPEENGFDRIRAVAVMHRRMVNPDEFKLIMAELASKDRESAWDLINRGTHDTGPVS